MIKNIIALFLSLMVIVFIASNRVFALRDNEFCTYSSCDIENSFLNSIGVDKLRVKFFDKFILFDENREENENLMKINRELNSEIKERLKENKSNLSQDIWKEIRTYKNEINDMKMLTHDKVKDLISKHKQSLKDSNYSDESMGEFVDVLIDIQKMKRESIEFEQNYLHKISDLI